MKPEEQEELLAAYALGTLSEPDAAAVEALVHMDGRAAEELARYHDVVDLIALGAPLRRADPSLRKRLKAAARRRRRPRRVLRVPQWRTAAIAAMAAALAGVFLWGIETRNELNSLRDDTETLAAIVEADAKRLESLVAQETDSTRQEVQARLETVSEEQSVVVAITTDPDAWNGWLNQTGASHGATGHVTWSASQGAGLLVASDLPPLPLDTVYEVWVADSVQSVSAALFVPEADGSAQILLQPEQSIRPLRISVAVAPAGGAERMQQPVVLTGLIDY